jgi:hypothetical protein
VAVETLVSSSLICYSTTPAAATTRVEAQRRRPWRAGYDSQQCGRKGYFGLFPFQLIHFCFSSFYISYGLLGTQSLLLASPQHSPARAVDELLPGCFVITETRMQTRNIHPGWWVAQSAKQESNMIFTRRK